MRICVINFLNSMPYRMSLEAAGFHVEAASPRECSSRFISGAFDAALVPVRHAWILESNGVAQAALPFGIASQGATWSTLLFGPEDLRSGEYDRITTNGDSSSAATLSQVLFEERFGHSQVILERAEPRPGAAHLVIGDDALALWHLSGGRPKGCHDVAELWWNEMGLPFVFARWIVRKDLSSADVERLCTVLDTAATLGRTLLPEIVSGVGGSLPADFVSHYLAHLRFRLNSSDLKGELQFRTLSNHRRACVSVDAHPTSGESFWLTERNGAGFVDTTCDAPEHARRCQKSLVTRQRLGIENIISLLTSYPASDMFARAHQRRCETNDPSTVTYVIDSNPNYSNLCDAHCSFCAFYVPPTKRADGYEHSIDTLLDNFRRAAERGATTILLQGGHHPSLPLEFYVELVRRTRTELPHVTPHFWSAGEVRRMAEVSGVSIRDVVRRLVGAGQVSLPGGGAEILSSRVRSAISPLKGSVESWIEVHRIAHEEGMKSTATMMYGHVEAASDVAKHLLAVRELQDATGGFTAFVPWSFKHGATPLGHRLSATLPPNALTYARVIAAARLALDNVSHIQASFFSEGWEAGELALLCGADDVGGVLLEENVHKAAGHQNPTPVEDVRDRIERAGFRPLQRDTLYRPISVAPSSVLKTTSGMAGS